MLLGRGVRAFFDADKAWNHSCCSLLRVERHGEVFSIRTGLYVENDLLFLGSLTDRFAIASTSHEDYPPGIVLFDLEERDCDHLYGFPHSGSGGQYCNVHSLACSGSGNTIAAVVSEFSGDVFNIHVLSLDSTKEFVYNTRTIPCERIEPGFSYSLVCFIGSTGSSLIVVHYRSGHVFRLGQELGNGVMNYEAVEDSAVGRILANLDDDDADADADDGHGHIWDEIVSVACVHGTNTILALLCHHYYVTPSWGIVEASLDADDVTGTLVMDGSVGSPVAISHETGVGVVVYLDEDEDHKVYSDWYSMDLGVMRQCWMEACVRTMFWKW
jgi:hypothetical protein